MKADNKHSVPIDLAGTPQRIPPIQLEKPVLVNEQDLSTTCVTSAEREIARKGREIVARELFRSNDTLIDKLPELRDPFCRVFDYGNEFEFLVVNKDGSLAHGIGCEIAKSDQLFHEELQPYVVEITTRPNAFEDEVRASVIKAYQIARQYGARLSGGGVSFVSPSELTRDKMLASERFEVIVPSLYRHAQTHPNLFRYSYGEQPHEKVAVEIFRADDGEHYLQFPNLSYGPLSAYQEALGTSWQLSFQPASPRHCVVHHRVVEMTSLFRDAFGGSPLVFGQPSGVMIPRVFNWIGATHSDFTLQRSFSFDHFCKLPEAQTTHIDNVLEQLYLTEDNVIPLKSAHSKDIRVPDHLSEADAHAMRLALLSTKNHWPPNRTNISATEIYGGGLIKDTQEREPLVMPRLETRDADTPYTFNDCWVQNDIFISLQWGMLDYLRQHFPIDGNSMELGSALPFRNVIRDRFAVAVAGIDAKVSKAMFTPGNRYTSDSVGNIWREHINEIVLKDAEGRNLEPYQFNRLQEELELRSYLDRSILLKADGSHYAKGTLGASTGHYILDFYARLTSRGMSGEKRDRFMQRAFCDCFEAALSDPSITFSKFYLTELLPQLNESHRGRPLATFVVDNPVAAL